MQTENTTVDLPHYVVYDEKTRVVQYLGMSLSGISGSPGSSISEDLFNEISTLISNNKIVTYKEDGTITSEDKPALPIKEQAQNAYDALMANAPQLAVRGKTFGPKTNAYADALENIIQGKDTTSTSLPTAPDDPLD